MVRPMLALIILLLLLSLPGVALGQVQITDQVTHKFGEFIEFRGQIQEDAPVQSLQLFIQPEHQTDTISSPPLIPEAGSVEYQIDPNQEKIRAFSTLEYWFEVTMDNGDLIATPRQTYSYDDNRFTWENRSEEPIDVYWHDGDASFGQAILDVAQQGLEQINSLLPMPSLDKVRIYAYANAVDLRATLQISNKNWVGAHTDPDLGVMVVSLPPGPEQRLEMERQIPHELMHIMLYKKIGPAYTNLPIWLNEGLASIAELYPNPDYLVLLNDAYENDSLPPISSLCTSFPRDAAGAYLAYAQSASFTRFLQQQYGSSGLDSLLLAYADGLDCERGIQIALGSDLTQLELRWRRETFGQNPWFTALTNLAPWLVLMAAVLVVPVIIVAGSLRRKATSQQPIDSRVQAK